MFKRAKEASEKVFEKIIDKSLSREGLSVIVGSAVIGSMATVVSLVNLHKNTEYAVQFAMGNTEIAQQIYDKTNKSGSIDYIKNHLASMGVNLAGDIKSDAEKTDNDTVSSYYIKYFAEEYNKKLLQKYGGFDKINAKQLTDNIYKNTLDTYGKESPDMAFALTNEIGEKVVKQSFLKELNSPNNELKLKLFNNVINDSKKDKVLEFNEFKKKITSTKDEAKLLNMYSDYISQMAKKSEKADKEVSNFYNSNENTKAIDR